MKIEEYLQGRKHSRRRTKKMGLEERKKYIIIRSKQDRLVIDWRRINPTGGAMVQ